MTYTLWAGADVAATLDASGQASALYTSYPGVEQPHNVRTGGVNGTVRYFAQSALGNVDGLMDAAGRS